MSKEPTKPTAFSLKDWEGQEVYIKTETESFPATLLKVEHMGAVIDRGTHTRLLPWAVVKDVRRNSIP